MKRRPAGKQGNPLPMQSEAAIPARPGNRGRKAIRAFHSRGFLF